MCPAPQLYPLLIPACPQPPWDVQHWHASDSALIIARMMPGKGGCQAWGWQVPHRHDGWLWVGCAPTGTAWSRVWGDSVCGKVPGSLPWQSGSLQDHILFGIFALQGPKLLEKPRSQHAETFLAAGCSNADPCYHARGKSQCPSQLLAGMGGCCLGGPAPPSNPLAQGAMLHPKKQSLPCRKEERAAGDGAASMGMPAAQLPR